MAIFRVTSKLFSFHTEFSKDTVNLSNDITLKKTEPIGFAKWLSKFSRSIRKEHENTIWYYVHKDSEVIGDMQIDVNPEEPTILHLGWIGIEEDYRHNGYATEVLKYFISEAKRKKFTKIILEATEMGYPIYKKLGFKELPVEPEEKSLFWRFMKWCHGMEEAEKLVDMELVL